MQVPLREHRRSTPELRIPKINQLAKNIILDLGTYLKPILNNKRVFILTSRKIIKIYEKKLLIILNKNNIEVNILDLKESVEVIWDENQFPHIFAHNDKPYPKCYLMMTMIMLNCLKRML